MSSPVARRWARVLTSPFSRLRTHPLHPTRGSIMGGGYYATVLQSYTSYTCRLVASPCMACMTPGMTLRIPRGTCRPDRAPLLRRRRSTPARTESERCGSRSKDPRTPMLVVCFLFLDDRDHDHTTPRPRPR